MTRHTLTEALLWRDAGVSAIPCHLKSKKSRIYWPRWIDKLPSIKNITKWFSEPCNLALITGLPSGLIVLDFDDIGLCRYWLKWASNQDSAARTIAKDGYRVKTFRGMHIYLEIKKDFSSMKKLISGLDIVAGTGYVLGYPSIHPSGFRYTPVGERNIYSADCLESIIPIEWINCSKWRDTYWHYKTRLKRLVGA
jgi:hypothetical protein